MSSKDEWRITSAAIEMEMERIADLLQKSTQFQSRTTACLPCVDAMKPSWMRIEIVQRALLCSAHDSASLQSEAADLPR
jgi:hypothetical protein